MTLFVILGILVLALIGTYLYVKSEKTGLGLQKTLLQALGQDEPKKLIALQVSSTIKAGLASRVGQLLNPLIPLFSSNLKDSSPPSELFPSTSEEKPKCSASSTPPPSPPSFPPATADFETFPHTFIGDQYVYYFDLGGVENIPTPQQLSHMIEQKIKNDLPYVLDQIPPDLLQNYVVLQDQIQVQVMISANQLRTQLSIPICAAGQPPTSETLQTTTKTHLLPLLDFAKWIIEQDIEHPEYIDFSTLQDEAERRNMKLSLIEEEGSRIYTLVDMDPDTDQAFTTLHFASLLET